MPFQHMKLTRYFLKRDDLPSKYIYQPTNGDALGVIMTPNYFKGCRFALDPDWIGAPIEISFDNGKTFNVIAVKEDGAVIDITPKGGLPGDLILSSIHLLMGNDRVELGTLKDLHDAMKAA